MIRFTYNDRLFDVDINTLSINEALEIKRRLGITVGEYTDGILYRNDAAALAALVSVAHRRADLQVDWDALGQFDVIALINSITSTPEDTGDRGRHAADDDPADDEQSAPDPLPVAEAAAPDAEPAHEPAPAAPAAPRWPAPAPTA